MYDDANFGLVLDFRDSDLVRIVLPYGGIRCYLGAYSLNCINCGRSNADSIARRWRSICKTKIAM